MPLLLAGITTGVRTETPQVVVGLVRFSLLLRNANYFPNLKHLSFDDRVKSIFGEERLKRRFDVFENICLPSLMNQTDQGFNIAILTSKFLPDWAMDRLEASVAGSKNIFVRPFRANANYMNLARRAVFELLDHQADIYTSFNLDDDDALAVDYVERLRPYLTTDNAGKALTFRNGYELRVSGDQLRLRRDRQPKASAGLAGINAGPIGKVADIISIFDYGGHRKVDTRFPLIIDESDGMYLQSANGTNVSLRKGEADTAKLLSAEEISDRLATKFPHLTSDVIRTINQSV